MQIPTIHDNGTPASTLITEVEGALEAIQNAIDAVCAITVNGRDYYVQGILALGIAEAEHMIRINTLRSLETELMDYLDGILSQER